jgi:hypothetical protein
MREGALRSVQADSKSQAEEEGPITWLSVVPCRHWQRPALAYSPRSESLSALSPGPAYTLLSSTTQAAAAAAAAHIHPVASTIMASATSAASRQIVIILGAGPGLGYSCAKIFARQGHPIALLSRNLSTLQDLSAKLQKDASIDESRVRAYSVDSTKKSDIEDAFKKIQNESWGKERAYVHTGIFNPGGGFAVKPFLDFSEQDLKNGLDTQV